MAKNYKEFVNSIIEEIKKEIGMDTEISMHTVTKPNEQLQGLTIRPTGARIAPTIYPEELYKQHLDGRSLENITESIIKAVREPQNAIRIPEISLEEAKKSLYLVAINYEKNRDLLADVPHERFQDLALVPRWKVGEEASFLVHDNILPELKLTKEELLEIAQSNTEKQDFKVTPLPSILRSIMGDEYADDILAETPPEISMYVVTNARGIDGAVAMACDKVMKSVHGQIGEDVFIIPCSRHEIICVKKSECPDTDALAEMVASVNSTTVSRADYLSDSVYAYDGHKITMANTPTIEKTEVQTQYRAAAH